MRKVVKSVLLFVSLWLAACSDSGEEVVFARFDKNGYQFSPASLQGTIDYLPTMEPLSVRIMSVDKDLNPVDTIDLPIDSSDHWDRKAFDLTSQDVRYPVLKIVTTFKDGEKSKKEFSQYYRLNGSHYSISLNIHMSLVAARVEYLVREENFDFSAANDSALNELNEIFKVYAKTIGYSSGNNNVDFENLMPYIFCKHEVSDSAFYENYKKVRESFAKNGFVESAIMVDAADTWLSTFKRVESGVKGKLSYASVSRDTAVGIKAFEPGFFGLAYGMHFPTQYPDSVQIKCKSSAYDGKYFIYDTYDNGGFDSHWRLKDSLEDSIGICIFETRSIVMYKGDEYLCREESNIWEKNVSQKELLSGYYQDCGTYYEDGSVIFVRDSLYLCECEKSGSCAWSDKYAGKEITEKDTLVYAKALDIKASRKLGQCYSSGYGDRKIFDSLYVQCIGRSWTKIDSLTYYLNRCTKDRVTGKHLGVYYGCRDFADYSAGDTVWTEIPAPVYRNVICDEKSLKKVEEDNGDYFICESKKVEGSDDVKYKWRKLDSAEAIPPVVNMETCEVHLKKMYDGVVYKCYYGVWSVAKDEELLPFEKEGELCSEQNYWALKEYEGQYYLCERDFNHWEKLDAHSAARYVYRDSIGTCDTLSKKTIIRNEKAAEFWGCITKNNGPTWGVVTMNAIMNDTIPSYFDKNKFSGGTIVNDSIYKVAVDEYEFWFRKICNDRFGLYRVDISGITYSAYFSRDNLFIRGKQGTESVPLNLIENKSDGFDAFYTDWKTRSKDNSECGTLKAEVDDATVFAYNFSEGTYMDLEHARQYCPEGFHIPTQSEISKAHISYIDNVSPIMWSYEMDGGENCPGDSAAYNILWTSDEKDSKTQICLEYVHFFGRSGYKKSEAYSHEYFVDCPKDLYPMVQTLCIKDR